jgi:hypothetical protein
MTSEQIAATAVLFSSTGWTRVTGSGAADADDPAGPSGGWTVIVGAAESIAPQLSQKFTASFARGLPHSGQYFMAYQCGVGGHTR